MKKINSKIRILSLFLVMAIFVSLLTGIDIKVSGSVTQLSDIAVEPNLYADFGSDNWTGSGLFSSVPFGDSSKVRINIALANGVEPLKLVYSDGAYSTELYYSPVRRVYDGVVPTGTYEYIFSKTEVVNSEPTVILHGDINKSGDVDTKDVKSATAYCRNITSSDSFYDFICLDADGDNSVTNDDVKMIQDYYLGRIPDLYINTVKSAAFSDLSIFCGGMNVTGSSFKMISGDRLILSAFSNISSGSSQSIYTGEYDWSSSSVAADIADDGMLTAVSEGSSVITVSVGGKSASVTVVVDPIYENILPYSEETSVAMCESSVWDELIRTGFQEGFCRWTWEGGSGEKQRNKEMFYLVTPSDAENYPQGVKIEDKSLCFDLSKASPPVYDSGIRPTGKIFFTAPLEDSDVNRVYTVMFWFKAAPGVHQNFSNNKLSLGNLSVDVFTYNDKITVPELSTLKLNLTPGDVFKNRLYESVFKANNNGTILQSSPVTADITANTATAENMFRNGEWLLYTRRIEVPSKNAAGSYNNVLNVEITLDNDDFIDARYYFDGMAIYRGARLPDYADGSGSPVPKSDVEILNGGQVVSDNEQVVITSSNASSPKTLTISSSGVLTELNAVMGENPLNLSCSLSGNNISVTAASGQSYVYNGNESKILVSGKLDGVPFYKTVLCAFPLSVTYKKYYLNTPVSNGHSINYFDPIDVTVNIGAPYDAQTAFVDITPSTAYKNDIRTSRRLIEGNEAFRFISLENVTKTVQCEVAITLDNNHFQKQSISLNLLPAVIYSGAPGEAPYGMYAVGNDLYRNGSKLHAIGVNYFTASYYPLVAYQRDDDEAVFRCLGVTRDNFALLRDYEMPCARIAFSGFDSGQIRPYFDPATHDGYLAVLDEVVKEAERNGIGLLPSFFWSWNMISDLVGEHLVEGLGAPGTNSWHFMEYYIRDIIARYINSPAIWGWEFGNEQNLNFDIHDLPVNSFSDLRMPANAVGSAGMPKAINYTPQTRVRNQVLNPLSDNMTMLARNPKNSSQKTVGNWAFMYWKFNQIVISADPSGRITHTGNGFPRGCNFWDATTWENNWHNDTRDQFKQILVMQNSAANPNYATADRPAGVPSGTIPLTSTLGGHMYETDASRPWVVSGLGKTNINQTTELERHIYFMTAIREINYPMIVGEFGRADLDNSDNSFDPARARATYSAMLNAAYQTKIPLMLIWNFGTVGDYSWEVHPVYSPGRTYQLEMGRAYNRAVNVNAPTFNVS